MKQVNLRELYPDAYEDDEYIDVSDEVYETLCEFERKEAAIARHKRRHEILCEVPVKYSNAASGVPLDEQIILREQNRELNAAIDLPTQLEKALRIQAGLEPRHITETEITPAGFLPESSTTAKGVGYQEECAPTLKAGGKSSAVMLPVLCLNDQGGSVMECSEDVTGTLRAQEHGHQPLVFANHSADFALLLRRLMPVECERLQGYPDDWTDIPGASDSARYKALGNSVAIPCVELLMLTL